MNKLSNKLTEILGIEGFRKGDVVENLDSNLLVLYNLANQTMFCMADIDDNYLESAWYKKDDLKLISRDFQLSDCLFCIEKKYDDRREYLLYATQLLNVWELPKSLFNQPKMVLDFLNDNI